MTTFLSSIIHVGFIQWKNNCNILVKDSYKRKLKIVEISFISVKELSL